MATTTASTLRPPVPEPPQGMLYTAVPDPDWRVAEGGYGCLTHGPASDGLACGKPAAAEKRRPNDRIRPWGAYCAEHALRQGAWAEDGKVLKWELRHADGRPLNAREAARARLSLAARRTEECPQHHCPPAMCPPESTHPYSVRFRKDLREGAEQAAAGERTDMSAWIRQAMEVRLDYLRCTRCRDTAPPVPVTFGDLTGKTLGEWIAEAAKQVRSQHPRHEPVTIGAEPATAPSAARSVRFVEPKQAAR